MTRRRRLLRVLLLCLVIAIAAAVVAAASHPPYDPRPLTQAAGPEKTAPFTFAVFGDSYANRPLEALLKMVAAHKPDLAVTTGDMVSSGEPSAWDRLSDRAGWFFTTVPTWPVIGNHEPAGGYGAEPFRTFYHLPQVQYSFRFRNAKFIVLDHSGAAPAGQIAFLRRELADRGTYRYAFVFRHEPFYTVGTKSHSEVPDEPTEETKLFQQYHVTAVFSGHDHTYYHTRRDGITYVISGSAGAGAYSLRRLSEGLPGDSYMGVREAGDAYVIHRPGQTDEVIPKNSAAEEKSIFAVFVHVNGDRVTADAISATGESWDHFALP